MGSCHVMLARVAVTVPPPHWFQGIAAAMYHAYRQALLDLGLRVIDVPVEPFLAGDSVRIHDVVRRVQAFDPEIAIGLPKGAYALLCKMPGRRGGAEPNLFMDVLDIPTIC